MPTCVNNYYFSGQGALMVAERHTDGTPKGFTRIGNVPSLELSIEVTKFEHKESCSGQRAIDLTIVQEKNGTFTMTLENFTPFNLALAAWGQQGITTGAAITPTIIPWEADKPHYLDVLTIAAAPAPVVTYDPLGVPAVLVENTDYVIDYEYGTISFPAAGAISGWTLDGSELVEVAVTSEDYTNVDALTVTSQQRWLRFEGLNTIDEKAVLIDIFKADLDPLTGLPLINDEIAAMEVTGSVLFDNLQAGDSKFFRARYAETSFDYF